MLQLNNEIRDIVKNLEEEPLTKFINDIKKKLEKSVGSDSYSEFIKSKNAQLEQLIAQIINETSFKKKSQKFEEIEIITTEILTRINKYNTSTNLRNNYLHLRQDSRSFSQTYLGLDCITKTIVPRKTSEQVSDLTLGFYLISNSIHSNPRIFIYPLVLIGLDLLCRDVLEQLDNFCFASPRAKDNYQFEYNKNTLRNSLVSIRWQVSELFKMVDSKEVNTQEEFLPKIKTNSRLVQLLDSWEKEGDREEQKATLNCIKNVDKYRTRKLFKENNNNQLPITYSPSPNKSILC
ncbi:MAG: hypothetical protein F6K14_00945 [Symploca sp. SIO2C1]|nr:hypothetical protein [Symploca sp. SIO2C1]